MSLINAFKNVSKGHITDLSGNISIPLIVMSGESNSGGIAPNSDATESELQPRPELKILNNTSLVFESLLLGTNNLIDHDVLSTTPPFNVTHSWENQLANKSANGEFGSTPIYLVKTGQGGSRIDQWSESDVYYTKFKTRVDAAISLLNISAEPKFVLLYSQGINDAIAGTDIEIWKSATIAHFNKIRTRYGSGIPIVMTKFMNTYASYSTAVEEVCNSVDNCYCIETSDLPLLSDGNHWTYTGQKTIANRMVKKLIDNGYYIVTATT